MAVSTPRLSVRQRPGKRGPFKARLSSQYRAEAFISSRSSFCPSAIHLR